MSNEVIIKNVNEFEVILSFELRKRKFTKEEIDDIVSYYMEIINERTLSGENVVDVLNNYDPKRIAFLLEPEMRLKRFEADVPVKPSKNQPVVQTTNVTQVSQGKKISEKVESQVTELRKKNNPDSFKKSSKNYLYVIKRCFSVPITIPLGIFIMIFFILFVTFYIVSVSMGIASFASIFLAIVQISQDTISFDLGIGYLGVYLIVLSLVCILFYYLGKLFGKLSKLSLKLIVALNKKKSKERK